MQDLGALEIWHTAKTGRSAFGKGAWLRPNFPEKLTLQLTGKNEDITGRGRGMFTARSHFFLPDSQEREAPGAPLVVESRRGCDDRARRSPEGACAERVNQSHGDERAYCETGMAIEQERPTLDMLQAGELQTILRPPVGAIVAKLPNCN